MNATKTVLLTLLMTGISLGVSAQKFAVVESQQIMENMPEAKGIQDQLAKLKEAAESDFAVKAQKFQDDVQDYQQKQAMLSADRKKALEAELGQRQQELAQIRDQKTQELQKKQVDLLKPLEEKVMTAIETVAKKEGYVAVFDKSSTFSRTVLYADDSLDITFKVLDFLKTNKSTPAKPKK